jgi:glycerophosphoryl diester phosphodiesterase
MILTRTQTIVLLFVAALFFGFTLAQASWLADKPAGKPKLIAAHGVEPVRDAAGCVASANAGYGTVSVGPDVGALQGAVGAGADAVRIATEMVGGVLVLAPQFKSKCGADNARPRITPSEAAAGLTKPELFWQVKNEADARQLIAKLPMPEVDVLDRNIIIGDEAAVRFVRSLRPGHRVFSISAAQKCASDYRVSGMWGSIPASCGNGTMLLTLDDLGYTLWGWPNRFLERMATANVRVIIAKDVVNGEIKGLTDVTQYGEIADSYNGYILRLCVNPSSAFRFSS